MGFKLSFLSYFSEILTAKNNFETVILAIIGLSLLPMLVKLFRSKYKTAGNSGMK
jgi:hypothetical protein